MTAVIHSGPILESGKKYNKGQNLYSGNPLEKWNCKEDQSSISKRNLTFGIEIKPHHFKIQSKREFYFNENNIVCYLT